MNDNFIYINNETIRMYTGYRYGKRVGPCSPVVLNDDTLMSGDGEFMDKDRINKKCDCNKKNTCKMLVDLLQHNKVQEAKDIISNDLDLLS